MLYEETALQNDHFSCSTFIPFKKERTLDYLDQDNLSDKILWEAFKQGDELAFIKIYKNYSKVLYEYGCKYSPDKEMVRDCLQDFFLYLRKNRLGFGETNSIKLYLFKAFRRRVVDYHKKNGSDFSLNEPLVFSQVPSELSIESIYINKQVKAEQLEKLNIALTTLDRKERQAIYYFYFKGLSYEQIAERFNFSHVSSARRVMYRGLRQLRSFLSISRVEC